MQQVERTIVVGEDDIDGRRRVNADRGHEVRAQGACSTASRGNSRQADTGRAVRRT